VIKLKCLKIVVFTAVFSFQLVGWALTSSSNSFSESQKKQIEQIFHEYLMNKPEILIEASRALQHKQQQEALVHAQTAIPDNAERLFNSKSPVIGNASGEVHLVEFFDYQCVHCRDMYPVVQKLVANNKRLRVVLLEFPIFGEFSKEAAETALAAGKQGKYYDFHVALMKLKPPLSKSKIRQVAETLKLDMGKLEKDLKDESIAEELKKNMELAQSLGIMGTPAFIVASNVGSSDGIKSFFVPGASTYQMLQSLIQQAGEKTVPSANKSTDLMNEKESPIQLTKADDAVQA